MLCYIEDTSSTSFTRARISYCSVPSLVVRSCAHIPQLFVSGRSVCISRKVCLFFRRNYKIFFELKSVSEIQTVLLFFCSSKVVKICSIRVPNLFWGIVNQAAVRKLVNFWFDWDLIQLISWSCDDDGITFIGFFSHFLDISFQGVQFFMLVSWLKLQNNTMCFLKHANYAYSIQNIKSLLKTTFVFSANLVFSLFNFTRAKSHWPNVSK